jgi:predicted phage tail protein
MLRKIKLYGPLAEFIGRRVLQADIATAAEAVRFLVANFPGVEQHMADQHYRVSTGNLDLSLDELHYPAGQEEVRIAPVVVGAGGGATGRIILGAALIAFAIVAGPAVAAFGSVGTPAVGGVVGLGGSLGTAATGFVLGGAAATAIATIGASLVLGGVAQLLSPVPKVAQGVDTQSDPRKSYSFSGIQQTSRQGVPVPVVYGKTLTGSVVISAGVDTVQVKA